MKTALVWFKTDLRLSDNETLVKAIAQNDRVVPVYCLDDAQFTLTKFGFRKMGSFRAKLLLESLQDLEQQLRALGSGLVVVKGTPAVEIPKLARLYQAQRVYAKTEVAYEEIQTEASVRQALQQLGCSLVLYNSSTLFATKDLPYTIPDLPEIFTNFRKKVEKETQVRATYAKPTAVPSPQLPIMTLPTLKELDLETINTDIRSAFPFAGGERQALKRLAYYFFESRLVSCYKLTRNGLISPDYSTKFSPWLAMGCVSPRTIYWELMRYEQTVEANESTYWVFFELLWRDYFRFMMQKHDIKYFQRRGIHGKQVPTNVNPEHLQRWVNGQTGVDFVDANMVELKNTGFMSNRGRQNVASFFVHELKMDWRYGAAYFEQQLIDYDPCSNWGNWAYMAGVGNDPRGQRAFNIEKQANDYDKDKVFRNLWL